MEVEVRLHRKEKQPLGIFFRRLSVPPFCQVAKLLETGAAQASGEIKTGDLLLTVNDRNVQYLTPEEVKDVLRACSEDLLIKLTLRRHAVNGEVATNGPAVPDTLPLQQRSPRRARRTGMTDLPEIVESGNAPSNVSPAHRQRHSLTPESTRKLIAAPLAPSKSVDLHNLPQFRQMTRMIQLQNLIDGTEIADRLHTKTRDMKVKESGCQHTYCKGSHMMPKEHKPKRPYSHPRPKEEVIPLAEDFVKQYYESKKHALGDKITQLQEQRMAEVKAEIDAKGHYELTYEELVFGARMAWRNAPRCVNRIVWRQLEVLDARAARTAKEMFDAIIHHMEYANNGGNLRSTITIFPHRSEPNSDYRVWNSQLVSYAGYKNDDGSILGDPAKLEFTDLCIRLGWQPPSPKTEFDLLPLILQAAGGEPQWFTIPPEVVIEVQLVHPDHPWFEELGLKWYVLPAVSNVALDCGGMEFPGAPFSGWYMSTEIGRDLGDVNRYNKLKAIADKMGLNTQRDKLWKDRAIVELNISILHSFQKSNVSIVDHHSATESFMTHMKTETQTRGGCPADWVWIVPPISGSITPVFHQEMLLYHLSPSYEYQDDPWKHYRLPSQRRERASSFSFKTVAKMVRNTTRMYSKVYERRVKATILYATETGKSRNYATTVKNVFDQVFATKMLCMEDYNRGNLEQEQLLLIVTSTFGSGDPPCNGETFGRYLLDLKNKGSQQPGMVQTPTPRSHRMSTVVAPPREQMETANQDICSNPLSQVRYGVFGLGSRAYPNFCTFAHTCDNLLKHLGAQQIYGCGEGDELCGQEESFQAWLKDCYLQACEIYKLDPRLEDGMLGFKPGYTKENFRVCRYHGTVPEKDICARLKEVHTKEVYPAIVKSRTKLQSPQSDRSTILVVMDTNKQPLHYEPGDHIAIYPRNNAKVVSEIISRLKFEESPDEPFTIEQRRRSTSGQAEWQQEQRLPIPVTLREAFTYYLDIMNPPTPQFLKLLSQQATKNADREELEELSRGGDSYEDWKYDKFPNLLDVLNNFHSLKVDVTFLLQQLPLLQCRYYSISSSPKMFPGQVHATVAVVSFKKRGGTGPEHHGVCSTWLNRIKPGTVVPCFIRKAHAFHLPDNPRIPVIMVGPGTGIAPFRSFWQHRMHKRNELLKSQLKAPMATKLKVKPALQPQDRRRRMTTFAPPKLELLGKEEVAGPIPMRRSASDTGDTQELAKMIAEKQKAWGTMSLFFGCRHSNMDHIYKEEMMKAHITGALSEVHVGLSREPNKPKTYVQHLVQKNADSIVRQLLEEGGHFYVCGDISMAADVTRTLQNIFEEYAAMSPDESRRMIESMKVKGVYHEDIFGVTLKTEEVTKRIRNAARKQLHFLVATPDQSGKMPLSPTTPGMKRLATPSTPRERPTSPRLQIHSARHQVHSSNFTSPRKQLAPRISLPTSELQLHRPQRQPRTVPPPSNEVGEKLKLGSGAPTSDMPKVKVLDAVAEMPEVAKSEEKGAEETGRKERLMEDDEVHVEKRSMSSEKKKIRRIRTGSKVETEI